MMRNLLFNFCLLFLLACRQGPEHATMRRIAHLTSDWSKVGQACLYQQDEMLDNASQLDSLYQVWKNDQEVFDAWRNSVTAGKVDEHAAQEALKIFEARYQEQAKLLVKITKGP